VWILQVFGGDINSVDPNTLSVEPSRGSPLSKRLNAVIGRLRSGRAIFQQCYVIRQGSPAEMHVQPFLAEDRTAISSSYADFMTHLFSATMQKSN
jgi:hypothetical protein